MLDIFFLNSFCMCLFFFPFLSDLMFLLICTYRLEQMRKNFNLRTLLKCLQQRSLTATIVTEGDKL